MNATKKLIKLLNTVARVEYHASRMTRMSRGQHPQTGARATALTRSGMTG